MTRPALAARPDARLARSATAAAREHVAAVALARLAVAAAPTPALARLSLLQLVTTREPTLADTRVALRAVAGVLDAHRS
ncbi:MAG: hypothetical protein ABI990_02480 [Actinomycetota bacterium]